MKKIVLTVIAALAISLSSSNLFAQTTASGDIVATLTGNSDYNVMAILIRTANLETTLKGAGPFTIFAPSNAAFSALSSDKIDALMKDPATLATVLRSHMVNGKFDKAALLKALAYGSDTLKTLDNKPLILHVNDQKHLELIDADGNKASVIAFDILGSNGVAIGIDGVLTKKD